MSTATTKPPALTSLPDHTQLPDRDGGDPPLSPSDQNRLPDHTQLPDRDGSIVQNFQEHPQSLLLTDALGPVLARVRPDGRYCIGQDCGIYWQLTDPPERGAVAPDWFYVPGVPATLDGRIRRSYVLWREWVPPLIVLEFVSGNGTVERDRTPTTGKFWIYENIIRPDYYAIYEVDPGRVEVHRRTEDHFEPCPPNARGHYPIAPLGVELGIWQGWLQNVELPWLRWWSDQGDLLPTGHERAAIEARRAEHQARRAEHEAQRAEFESRRAERLAAQLRALGIEPEA